MLNLKTFFELSRFGKLNRLKQSTTNPHQQLTSPEPIFQLNDSIQHHNEPFNFFPEMTASARTIQKDKVRP